MVIITSEDWNPLLSAPTQRAVGELLECIWFANQWIFCICSSILSPDLKVITGHNKRDLYVWGQSIQACPRMELLCGLINRKCHLLSAVQILKQHFRNEGIGWDKILIIHIKKAHRENWWALVAARNALVVNEVVALGMWAITELSLLLVAAAQLNWQSHNESVGGALL